MPKQQINVRLGEEAGDAARRLRDCWAYRGRTDAVEASLVCWEAALADAGRRVAGLFDRDEWNLLAAACAGRAWPGGHAGRRAGTLLSFEVEAAPAAARDRLGGDPARVAALCRKLRELDYAGGWAVARALWWLRGRDDVDPREDEWWDPEFRRGRPAAGEDD